MARNRLYVLRLATMANFNDCPDYANDSETNAWAQAGMLAKLRSYGA